MAGGWIETKVRPEERLRREGETQWARECEGEEWRMGLE